MKKAAAGAAATASPWDAETSASTSAHPLSGAPSSPEQSGNAGSASSAGIDPRLLLRLLCKMEGLLILAELRITVTLSITRSPSLGKMEKGDSTSLLRVVNVEYGANHAPVIPVSLLGSGYLMAINRLNISRSIRPVEE